MVSASSTAVSLSPAAARSLLDFKLLSIAGILLLTVASAIIPLKLSAAASIDPKQRDRVLAHFSFFTGGVFLGAGLLHLLPDAVAANPWRSDDNDEPFPIVFLLAALGFTFVWAVEKLKLGGLETPVQKEKMVAVTTAAAADDADRLRAPGDGSSGNGLGSGASICYVRVEPVTTYNARPSLAAAAASESAALVVGSSGSSSSSSSGVAATIIAAVPAPATATTDSVVVLLGDAAASAASGASSSSSGSAAAAATAAASRGRGLRGDARGYASTYARRSSGSSDEDNDSDDDRGRSCAAAAASTSASTSTSATSAAVADAVASVVAALGAADPTATAATTTAPATTPSYDSTGTTTALVQRRQQQQLGGGGGGPVADERTALLAAAPAAATATAVTPTLSVCNGVPGSTALARRADGGVECGADHAGSSTTAASHTGLHEDVCVGAPIYEHSSAAWGVLMNSSFHPAAAQAANTQRRGGHAAADRRGGGGHGHAHGGGIGSDDDEDEEHMTVPSKYSAAAMSSHQQLHDHQHDSVHHHHIVIPGNSLWLPLLLSLIFSIHSFIEGLALGVQARLDNTAVSVLLAILAHKCVEALTVSSHFVKERVQLSKAVPVIAVYCAMTPLGIACGMLLNSALSAQQMWVETIAQGFASGSFLYLAIHEVQEERACHLVKSTRQVALLCAGLAFMALVAVWT